LKIIVVGAAYISADDDAVLALGRQTEVKEYEDKESFDVGGSVEFHDLLGLLEMLINDKGNESFRIAHILKQKWVYPGEALTRSVKNQEW